MEIADRPTILPITHDPNISDKVMYLQMAFKQRPLRDGGGKPSLGRLAPWARPLSKAAVLGARICVLTSPWGDKLQESLSLGEGSHPFPEDLLEDIREILAPGPGARGPAGVTDPPLTSPGIWPLKKELKGEEPEFQELPHPTGRGKQPLGGSLQRAHPGHISGGGPGMVEGPFSKEAAASRCGCASEDLCLWRALTRGARSARSTMARWEGPMTPSGTRRWRGRRLRRCWMGSKLSIGYMRQPRRDPLRVPLAPRGGSSNLHLGAGSGRSRAGRTSPRPTGE